MRGDSKMFREQRQTEAIKRNSEWQKLTPIQKLKELDKRPGNSAKQRKKIKEYIHKMGQIAELPC